MTFDDWWKLTKPAEVDEFKVHFEDCWKAARQFDVPAEVRRLHNRVERLRGLCKTASGWLLDAGAVKESDEILKLVGDMEKPLPKESA